MDIQKSTGEIQEPIKGHVQINIEKICNDPSISIQAMLASALWNMFNKITNVCEKLGIAKGKLGLATIQAGFNSANKTATAGLFQLGGGAILAGTGVVQGVAGCKSATELAEAAETRKLSLAEINESMLKDGNLPVEGSNITIEVEDLDEPVSGLDEVEEEIFYDAEETLSYKQTKPEEQAEEAKLAEKATIQNKTAKEKEEEKLAKKEANKEYDVAKDLIKSKADRLQGLVAPGQGLYYVSQGLGDIERSKAQKENIQKEVEQDNQNQLGNTADDLKRKADKIAEFDPFRSNSSSLRG